MPLHNNPVRSDLSAVETFRIETRTKAIKGDVPLYRRKASLHRTPCSNRTRHLLEKDIYNVGTYTRPTELFPAN